MTSPPLPYDDASTPAQMTADCQAASLALHLPRQSRPTSRTPSPEAANAFAVPTAAAHLAGRFAE